MRPVEVNYVNADVHNIDSEDGYQLTFPVRWSSNPSMNKAIGLRRLKYTPWWGCIGFTVNIYEDDDLVATHTTELMQFTSENTLQECIVAIQSAASFTEASTGEVYSCIIAYDSQGLALDWLSSDGTSMKFQLTFVNDDHQYAENLLKLLNQPVTNESIDYCTSMVGVFTWMSFDNVWNRQDLYFHASFSDSTRQIIGVNNDFWFEPSVYYEGKNTSDDFTLRFTDDTVTKIVPRHGVLLVQFSLIYNHRRYMS